jgi:hypothetical protein
MKTGPNLTARSRGQPSPEARAFVDAMMGRLRAEDVHHIIKSGLDSAQVNRLRLMIENEGIRLGRRSFRDHGWRNRLARKLHVDGKMPWDGVRRYFRERFPECLRKADGTFVSSRSLMVAAVKQGRIDQKQQARRSA